MDKEDTDEKEEYSKYIKPVLQETYALILDTKEPFIGEIMTLNETEKTVLIRDISNDTEN